MKAAKVIVKRLVLKTFGGVEGGGCTIISATGGDV